MIRVKRVLKKVIKKRTFRSAYRVGNFYDQALQWADTHSNPDITYHDNGNIAQIKYWRYYQSESNYKWTSILNYRSDGPSIQEFYKNGSLKEEKYTDYFGQLHRDNGPAIIKYKKDSSISEKYYIDNQLIGKNLKIYDKQILKEYIQNLEIMK